MASRISPLFAFAAFLLSVLAVVSVALAGPGDVDVTATPLATGFTYQGRVEQDGVPFSGNCDFKFALFGAETGSAQVGVTDNFNKNKAVQNGLFSIVVNASNQFTSAAFDGNKRWLETELRCPSGLGAFVLLGSRQELTPAPYATFAQDSARLGGFLASEYVRYTRIVIVSPVGTDAVASGAKLVAALAGITDASSEKRYLVFAEPGVYQLSASLQMKQYVDLQGAGKARTFIERTSGTIIQAAGNSEIRDLAVLGSGAGITAISGAGGSNTAIRRVQVSFAGQTGIEATGTLLVEDVALELICSAFPCTGILNVLGNLDLIRGDVVISTGSATTRGIVVQGGSATIADSEIFVFGAVGGTGNLAGVESGDFHSVTLSRSRVNLSSGGSLGTGMIVKGVTTIDSSTVVSSVTGGAVNIGIDSTFLLTVRDSEIRAANGPNSVAIEFRSNSSSFIQASRIVATSPGGIGVRKSGGGGTLRITGTDIESSGATINGAVGVSGVRVTASQLRGGAVTGGVNVVCGGNTNETTAFFASTCP